MSETPETPETDAARCMAWANEYMVPTEFARQLERERNEAIELLKKASEYSTTASQENTEKFLRKINKREGAK